MENTTLKTLQESPPWEWPENAGEVLLNVLKDEKQSLEDRLLAARMTGDTTVIDDNLAKALLVILKNEAEDLELREQSAVALAPALEDALMASLTEGEDLGEDPELDLPLVAPEILNDVRKTLESIYRNENAPEEIRRRSLEASVHAPEDWHVEEVKAAYKRDDDWKLTAVFCMRFVDGFDQEILDALDSKDVEVLYEAVGAAGTWEIDSAWDKLTTMMDNKDVDRELLMVCMEAISVIRPQEAIERIVPYLESDDEDIADAATEALEMAEMAGATVDGEESE